MVGLDATALGAGDWEAADRLRHLGYCLNEVCAIVGMRRDAEQVEKATSPEAKAPDGATVKGGIIAGRVPYRPDLAPPGIDKLFPEGPVKSTPPGEILIA